MPETKKPYVIVVGVDYSETGELAFDQALDIGAATMPAEVHALSVVTLLLPALPAIEHMTLGAVPAIPIADAQAQIERHVEKKLEELRTRRGLPVFALPRVVPHLRIEMPSQEIAQLASDLEADLVVVGTHGRRGVSRLLLGSVAEGVIRLAPCPVLVVRPKRLLAVPAIEPPCPECVNTRRATHGENLWCAQHAERHGQRHVYHQGERISSDGGMPLVYHG